MEIMEKKVSMTELFYDLIFVVAISKMTHVLHHLDNGVIEPLSYFKYLIIVISWINVWMIQAVFNNRYGDDDTIDQLFLYFDVFLLVYLLNSTSENFREVFFNYNLLIVIITFSQIAQYIRQFFKRKEEAHTSLVMSFVYIFLIKIIFIGIGIIIPYEIGLPLVVIGTLLSWLLPLAFIKPMKKYPVNFPNLVERMTLLIIIAFGETITGMIPYFKTSSLITTFLIFSSVVSLFYFYKMYFDNIINTDNPSSTGTGLIYLHYLILIGIEGLTVTIEFINEPNLIVNNVFLVSFLYAGLFVFYSGILLHYQYNKETHRFNKHCIIQHYIILLIGFLISLYFKDNHFLILITVTVINVFAALNIWKFVRNK
ncbi:low temperature requirement protein A [Fusobacterium simiae]|uniref:Low temperature requirement protein A n=1 Tax=Fusobacterium simiae TaxID=855 RepID=A0ABT4DJT0_FUSSI|nr:MULTISPECIES: low temperature requirement protein A [Fusobacterium]MCY7007761.1 low temperature requirement protein A [Fusobacterium simiae]MDC7956184.1 low temperature requirement protein A [Fusobacterium simiae]